MAERQPNETWTIKRILDWSTGYLKRNEIDAPRLTVELLLSKVLDYSRVQLYLRFDQPLIPVELSTFKAYLRRRIKREPTQYILGTQSFWSLDFFVDARVLIPRPETECLVEECLRLFKQGDISIKGPFLDLCTGSGALACALAAEFPEAEIDATDISSDALEVARLNVTENSLDDNIQLHESNLFEDVPPKKYSVVVSNPPYIRSNDMATLQQEVQHFEPSLALDGGEDGLDLVRSILESAPLFLNEGGFLLIEIGSDQGSIALEAAREHDVYVESRILQDYSDLDRVLCCQIAPSKEFTKEPSKESDSDTSIAELDSDTFIAELDSDTSTAESDSDTSVTE